MANEPSIRPARIAIDNDLQNILYFICAEIDAEPFYEPSSIRTVSRFIAKDVCGSKEKIAVDNVECCLMAIIHKLQFHLPYGNVARFSLQVEPSGEGLLSGILSIACFVNIKLANGVPVWFGTSFLLSNVYAENVMQNVPHKKINSADVTYDFEADLSFSAQGEVGNFSISN